MNSQESAAGRMPAMEENAQQPDKLINVGPGERKLCTAAGAALALLGLSRHNLPGLVIAGLGGGLLYRGLTGHCAIYEKLGLSSAQPAEPSEYFERGIHIRASEVIQQPADELYQFWRNFENLPRIMSNLESVRVIDDRRSHWVARAPGIAGGKVEWDAEIINDEPFALIAWRSLGEADVDNAGSVRFIPVGEGATRVNVVIDYIPPAGRVGDWVAKLFGSDPQAQICEDLRSFKQDREANRV
jgi:uncharacterized membrane protein